MIDLSEHSASRNGQGANRTPGGKHPPMLARLLGT